MACQPCARSEPYQLCARKGVQCAGFKSIGQTVRVEGARGIGNLRPHSHALLKRTRVVGEDDEVGVFFGGRGGGHFVVRDGGGEGAVERGEGGGAKGEVGVEEGAEEGKVGWHCVGLGGGVVFEGGGSGEEVFGFVQFSRGFDSLRGLVLVSKTVFRFYARGLFGNRIISGYTVQRVTKLPAYQQRLPPTTLP